MQTIANTNFDNSDKVLFLSKINMKTTFKELRSVFHCN
jgi:hypothetical protein